MPVHELRENPKIKVIFKGFIVTNIREGPTATIGALAAEHSLCHRPVIHVLEINSQGQAVPRNINVNIGLDFSLNVSNPAESGIRVYHKDQEAFNPLDSDNDVKDFRWFIDLNDLHREDITLNMDSLQPKFILNNGLFHTSSLSDEDARIKRPRQLPRRFGRYALEITARIYFDRPDTVAVFQNGGTNVLEPIMANSNRFEIIFDCNCRTEPDVSDFPNVYKVIRHANGQEFADPEKIVVSHDAFEMLGELGQDDVGELPPDFNKIVLPDGKKLVIKDRSPEVYCTGGNNGR